MEVMQCYKTVHYMLLQASTPFILQAREHWAMGGVHASTRYAMRKTVLIKTC